MTNANEVNRRNRHFVCCKNERKTQNYAPVICSKLSAVRVSPHIVSNVYRNVYVVALT